MPYTVKGKCVYKKNSGEKVGCTDGDVDKYLAALHANEPKSESMTRDQFYNIIREIITEQEEATVYEFENDRVGGEVTKDSPHIKEAFEWWKNDLQNEKGDTHRRIKAKVTEMLSARGKKDPWWRDGVFTEIIKKLLESLDIAQQNIQFKTLDPGTVGQWSYDERTKEFAQGVLQLDLQQINKKMRRMPLTAAKRLLYNTLWHEIRHWFGTNLYRNIKSYIGHWKPGGPGQPRWKSKSEEQDIYYEEFKHIIDIDAWKSKDKFVEKYWRVMKPKRYVVDSEGVEHDYSKIITGDIDWAWRQFRSAFRDEGNLYSHVFVYIGEIRRRYPKEKNPLEHICKNISKLSYKELNQGAGTELIMFRMAVKCDAGALEAMDKIAALQSKPKTAYA
jgi:hypothetical protein|tara:strand:- start:1060 stop:2226 length:1167 start_codon:yes stop_codon:yes gene_type:complete